VRTFTGIPQDKDLRDSTGNQGWPGIVSRFQLVRLAGHRSKQLYNGAQPRIPADPLKRRNTSIALEELRRGLVPFDGLNKSESQAAPASIDAVVNTTVGRDLEFDVVKAEYVNERP
jgi:DNA-directed RNA polymerase subunit K/omega